MSLAISHSPFAFAPAANVTRSEPDMWPSGRRKATESGAFIASCGRLFRLKRRDGPLGVHLLGHLSWMSPFQADVRHMRSPPSEDWMGHSSLDDYKSAADLVGAWLLQTAQREPDGWWWPAKPGMARDAATNLYEGIAGPALFFVEAYRTDHDERWLEPASGAAQWMAHHLEESAGQLAGCGLFKGVGGWALVLDELACASCNDGF